MNHHEDTEKVHQCREEGDQHNLGIGHSCQFCHDEPACPHDGRHEHSADGGRGFDASRDVRFEPGFFHHRNGESPGLKGVGNGASGDRTEKPACNH